MNIIGELVKLIWIKLYLGLCDSLELHRNGAILVEFGVL